jgi:predicted nuclease of predicted toxin-antitoxin system
VKFKLDENLGRRAAAVLVEAGFDIATVSDQRTEGAADRDVIDHCVREERCLVTMDAEFGNPLRFPPHRYRGIVLLRLPARVTSELILDTVRTLREALLARDRPPGGSIPLPGPDRRLWVVQPGRVRLYQGEESDDE